MNMDRMQIIKNILIEYRATTDDCLQLNLEVDYERMADLLDERDEILTRLTELNVTEEEYKDVELSKLIQNVKLADEVLIQKISDELNIIQSGIDENKNEMAGYGKNKIAMKNYVKSHDIDDSTGNYMDKLQ